MEKQEAALVNETQFHVSALKMLGVAVFISKQTSITSKSVTVDKAFGKWILIEMFHNYYT